MTDAEGGQGLALLATEREDLRRELAELTDKRKGLEAQREALGEELKGVDVEIEATQRMLGLVEATEQQLTAQGEAGPHESGPGHTAVEPRIEVRGWLKRIPRSSFDVNDQCHSTRQRRP
jgi:hypothetical protein